MTYTFFLIDACLFVLPFFLAIDRKHFQVEIIRSAVVPALIQAIFFSEIAVFFVQSKVWSISPAYTLGFGYRSLPLEVYLLVFALGFTGISAYNYLNLRFPDNTFQKYSLAVSNLMIGFFIAIGYAGHRFWFPMVTVAAVIILLLIVEYVSRLRFMYRFYRVFFIMLAPSFFVFGILANYQVLTYNAKETLGFKLVNAPVETAFYLMGILLLGVYLLENFKNREKKNGTSSL